VGERVVVLDGAGEELSCEVTGAGGREVTLGVVQRQRVTAWSWEVTLVQAVPKGRLMEFIVRKATELGVRRIVPVLSERTVPDWDPEEATMRRDRWRAAAIEAIKQCGSTWLPTIEVPRDVGAVLNGGPRAELTLVGSLQPGARHARAHFESFIVERGRMPATLSIWVGPEGDFTPSELNEIQAAGAQPITLGPLVLRCDTAALYCLATVNYEMMAPRTVPWVSVA
jgi:16S rRNA (uracil1498-N3)-methyltransferase